MKISDIIEYVKDENCDYDEDKARKLYNQGVDYYFLALAKWIGIIKGDFEDIGGYCGYCFHYKGCNSCPLDSTIDNLYCCIYHDPLFTIKNIVKQHKEKELKR